MKKPLQWIYLGAGLLYVFHLIKLIALLGPIAVMGTIGSPEDTSLSTWTSGFDLYVSEVSQSFALSTQYVIYVFAFTAVTSICCIVTSGYLALRRKWARTALFLLTGIIALNFVLAKILIIRQWSIGDLHLDIVVLHGLVITIFTRKPIIGMFGEQKT